MKITLSDLLRKLSSRKLWAMILGVVGAILVVLNVDALTIEQVLGIVSGMGAIVAYMFAEAKVDAARAGIEVAEKPPDEPTT